MSKALIGNLLIPVSASITEVSRILIDLAKEELKSEQTREEILSELNTEKETEEEDEDLAREAYEETKAIK
jgi:hypothetical protein